MWSTVLNNPLRTRYSTYLNQCNADLGALLEIDLDKGIELRNRYWDGGNHKGGTNTGSTHNHSSSGTQGSSSDHSNQAAPLYNIPIVVKDNIAIEDFSLTCGSRMLADFRATYSATTIQRLLTAGVVPVAKSNLDEFGMGSDSQHSYFGEVQNPWNRDYVPGGSSGGSAVAVASGMVPAALGSDTGGSVRQPASFCGVYGLKPTYGMLSRFGLVAYASSLETIGIFSATIPIMRRMLHTMRGHDPLDQTTLPTKPLTPAPSKPKIGYITQLQAQDSISQHYTQTLNILKELGYHVTPVQLDHLQYVAPTYYTIATAEASANLARYDGVRYGYRPSDAESPIEMTKQARSDGFGPEVQLRIVLGNYVLRSGFQERYYLQAQRIRAVLTAAMQRLFQQVQVLLLPSFPTPPFMKGDRGLDAFKQKQADLYTSLANLTGQPALAVPVGLHHGLPIGMQLMGNHHSEEILMSVAEHYGQKYPITSPPNYQSEWS